MSDSVKARNEDYKTKYCLILIGAKLTLLFLRVLRVLQVNQILHQPQYVALELSLQLSENLHRLFNTSI